MIRKTFSLFLTMILMVSLVSFAYADANISSEVVDIERIDYEDGSYAIVTTEETTVLTRAVMQKNGKRTYEYYEGRSCAWTFTITGTFTYDGSTAKASNPGRYTTINDSSWSTSSTSAYATGASIKGSATMKKGSASKTIPLTLTCSPDGTLI